jgi:hypothetical protein
MKLTYRCPLFVVHCPLPALLVVGNKMGGDGGNMVGGGETSDGGVKTSPTTIKPRLLIVCVVRRLVGDS